jgi:hypothetical protein
MEGAGGGMEGWRDGRVETRWRGGVSEGGGVVRVEGVAGHRSVTAQGRDSATPRDPEPQTSPQGNSTGPVTAQQ